MLSAVAEPLSARDACLQARQFSELQACGRAVFWLASEPETGNVGLWQSDAAGTRQLNTGASVRSRLNGYGGGSYAVMPGLICWVADDQSLWMMDLTQGRRTCLVDAPGVAWGGVVADPRRRRWLAVRETQGHQALVAVGCQGDVAVLDDRFDFYGAPVISRNDQVAWVTWQLPHLPWDQSQLCCARFNNAGELIGRMTGAPPGGGSVQQPQFVCEQLWALSDHRGWWQPVRVVPDQGVLRWQPEQAESADHANAPWQLAERHACPLPDGGWARVRYVQGWGQLWLERPRRHLRVAWTCSDFRHLVVRDNELVCIARRPDQGDSVLRIDLATGRAGALAAAPSPLSGAPCVWPESLVLPPDDHHPHGLQAFLYHPEQSRKAPPLILVAHGGPTSAAYATFNAQTQFWCQRGFAVAEVNYTGSTGFGRAFRQALAGQWGRADVADMMRMKEAFAAKGLIDPHRVFIQGRSSGGYTALMAATRTDHRIRGLASLFGVTDPLRLKAATHRFESGYLDWLLGPPGPEGRYWHSRTPARLAGSISCPGLFFQGGQDPVVVPQQTRTMVDAMKRAGQSAELVWFDEEGHGFRSLEHQTLVLESLWRFYHRLASG
ncbi:prolyl oligopeptidase family serine peptidase [Marinobacter daepoensis]|uniref:S9 family peptidase n=1 Tax=Marinobacter daepoensis TaxID=262077 RepID=A0ABS3BG30_9GAMM|nr:S9 family peptidase [Marinobacter daepoensis]MBY6079898.1 prolyl oligopeptidase family serine peptidase [Marinobacter daepoensis]